MGWQMDILKGVVIFGLVDLIVLLVELGRGVTIAILLMVIGQMANKQILTRVVYHHNFQPQIGMQVIVFSKNRLSVNYL
uniref:Uncharacterized protein n=1 Tax=Acrobeloides nanus TaxID=290746 RepID=A0A914CS89_9BILA